jgi:prepilin-type N-terminal cleavage/methylation domain-containing protein/prepilin-type processing-associated H-X9-DG protein
MVDSLFEWGNVAVNKIGAMVPPVKRCRKRAFTLLELLVVIAIIAVLAGMVLSAVSGVKTSSRKAQCLNNLKQMIAGSLMYSEDNSSGSFTGDSLGWPGERWPEDDDVNYLHNGYVPTLKAFLCPSTHDAIDPKVIDPNLFEFPNGAPWIADLMACAATTGNRHGTSYKTSGLMALTFRKTQKTTTQYVRKNEPKGMVVSPSQIWLHFDQDIDIERIKYSLTANNNHGASGANVSFCDGHVEWVRRSAYRASYDLSQDRSPTCWIDVPDGP